MVRRYAALAGDGTVPIPYVVQKPTGPRRSLGLTAEQLAGLRNALVAVVDRGTAAASGGRDLRVAGKTGTAQNPPRPDHGWFIAFAPAEKPTVVVGSIMEFALHGTTVAPYVVKVIRRYLEKTDPTLAKGRLRMVSQEDSATAVSELIADSAAPPPPR